MPKREAISNRIRFEIFKRDSFTCHYCSRKAPDVVLNIDHIKPVAKGWDNDILNLVTSCFTCNNGKGDKELDDNSVVVKKRKQLELSQERKEQLAMVMEWQNSLKDIENETICNIVEYIEQMIMPSSVNETWKNTIRWWLKKNSLKEVLDGIDTSADKYLRYIDDGVTPESVEDFFQKVWGILAMRNKPPIEQKIAYIKWIWKNRFWYWDTAKASILLWNYVSALKEHYTDEQILEDLDIEIMSFTKVANHWSHWKNMLESWTASIQEWEKR